MIDKRDATVVISLQKHGVVVKRPRNIARVAQSVERKALNLVVEGSSPSSGASLFAFSKVVNESFGGVSHHLRAIFLVLSYTILLR